MKNCFTCGGLIAEFGVQYSCHIDALCKCIVNLSDQIKAAAAFANCDGNSPETERGRQIALSSLQPLLDSLCACAEALETYEKISPRNVNGEETSWLARDKLATLRETLARMKG